jgi:hypothetical protein
MVVYVSMGRDDEDECIVLKCVSMCVCLHTLYVECLSFVDVDGIGVGVACVVCVVLWVVLCRDY